MTNDEMREKAKKIADFVDSNTGWEYALSKELEKIIEAALLDARNGALEEAVAIAYKNLAEHDKFSGDYDAGAVQACKNIAYEIMGLKTKPEEVKP